MIATSHTDQPALGTAAEAGHSAVGVVLNNDNRQVVADTTQTPACWIGRLRSTWGDNSVGWGTAALIGDRYLLTCAHNFYDTTGTGARCLSATFYPAQYQQPSGQPGLPYGAYQVADFKIPDEYYENGGPPPDDQDVVREITEYLYDYAVARLDRVISTPPGSSGLAVGLSANPSSNMRVNCTINGYSVDRNQGRAQQTRTGTATLDPGDEYFLYTMSTYNGDSGAPVMYNDGGTLRIAAVHVSGYAPTPGHGANFGPAIYTDTFRSMLNSLG